MSADAASGSEWPVGDTPTIADEGKLAAWLDSAGLGVGAPLEHSYISGGSQNEIYELRRGDLHCAMRIPPRSAPAPRDEGIVREWRIIEALGGTDVPHTEAIAVCTDQSVLGRTFYLMGFVDDDIQPGNSAEFRLIAERHSKAGDHEQIARIGFVAVRGSRSVSGMGSAVAIQSKRPQHPRAA